MPDGKGCVNGTGPFSRKVAQVLERVAWPGPCDHRVIRRQVQFLSWEREQSRRRVRPVGITPRARRQAMSASASVVLGATVRHEPGLLPPRRDVAMPATLPKRVRKPSRGQCDRQAANGVSRAADHETRRLPRCQAEAYRPDVVGRPR